MRSDRWIVFEWLLQGGEGLIRSKLLRALAGLALLGLSTLLWLGGRFWPWGWVVGGVLILLSIPERGARSDSF